MTKASNLNFSVNFNQGCHPKILKEQLSGTHDNIYTEVGEGALHAVHDPQVHGLHDDSDSLNDLN